MNKAPELPAKLAAKISDINTWIENPTKCYAVAHWTDTEMGAEWKIRIKDKNHKVVVDYLTFDAADGHSYYLFLMAMEVVRQKSFAEGMRAAASKVYENVCKGLGIQPEPIQYTSGN